MAEMEPDSLRRLCDYIGFGPKDQEYLQQAFPMLAPAFPEIVEEFYRTLMKNPGTRHHIQDEAQVERLKGLFSDWLTEFFQNPRDAKYLATRNRIGKVHVDIGLAQIYVFSAMGLVQDHLLRLSYDRVSPLVLGIEVRSALNKALTVEMAVLADGYLTADKCQALQAQERLAEIGAMGVSLAHEIKNPLSGISGAIQVFSQSPVPQETQRQVFAEIQAQIRRLTRLVDDLLQFGRPLTIRRERVALAPLIERTYSVLKDSGEFNGILLALNGEALHQPHAVDPHLLQQVFVNLFLNSAHAMAGKGTITVSAEHANRHLLVRVCDTGPGVPPEIRESIFRPFFTTKPQGSGLGLAICQRIVETHGGAIQSRPGAAPGAMFEIRIPTQPRETEP